MPIEKTALHNIDLNGYRLLVERQTILLNIQKDIQRNAARHKRMLENDGIAFETVAGFMKACADNYKLWLDNVETVADQPQLKEAMARLGFIEDDFSLVISPLKQQVALLKDTEVKNIAEIIALYEPIVEAVK